MDSAHVQKVLSSYYDLGNRAIDAVRTSSADDAHSLLRWFLLDMPVVPILLAFHSLFAAMKIHELTGGRQYWFKSLVLTMFAAFGGSTLSAVFSGSPAPLFTVSSNYMIGYITVAWYVVDQCKPLRVLLATRPFNAILAFGATAAKARAIFGFMDNFIPAFPGAVAGAVVLGGLTGSGGALFVGMEKKVRMGLRTPSELSSPGWGFKSAYMAAFCYYIVTDPEGVFKSALIPLQYNATREAARFAISLVLCSHAALETLWGKHINPVYIFEEFMYAVTRVQPVSESSNSGTTTQSSVPASGASTNPHSSTSSGKSTAVNSSATPRKRAGKGGK